MPLITHDIAPSMRRIYRSTSIRRFGNNALLARLLELEPRGGFAKYQSIDARPERVPLNVPTRMLGREGPLIGRAVRRGQLVAALFASLTA